MTIRRLHSRIRTNLRKSHLRRFLVDVVRECDLHGVKYIALRNRHIVERLFWVAIVATCATISIFSIKNIYRNYKESPVITAFQSLETDIEQIPFPAITLCNANMLKGDVLNETMNHALKKADRFLYNYTLLEEEFVILEQITQLCLTAPSSRRAFDQTLFDALGQVDFLHRLKNYLAKMDSQQVITQEQLDNKYKNVTEAFLWKASHNCDDMIMRCMWDRRHIPCHQLFRPVLTPHGICCTFNMMPTQLMKRYELLHAGKETRFGFNNITEKDKREWNEFGNGNIIVSEKESRLRKCPIYPVAGGKSTGLTILVNPELEVYSTCAPNDATGFKLVAHTPMELPSIQEYGSAIPSHSEVFVNVQPRVTVANEVELKPVDVEKRGCYLPGDERAQLTYYRFYTSANCIDECVARLTLEKCLCVRYFMPRNSSHKLCRANQLPCVHNVRVSLAEPGNDGPCSKCWPTCTDIKYQLEVSYFPLWQDPNDVFHDSPFEEINKLTFNPVNLSNYSIVHIFMGTESIYATERKAIFGYSEFLGSAAGVLELTLGFGIMTIVETVYFFTVKAWVRFREVRANRCQRQQALQKPQHLVVVPQQARDDDIEHSSCGTNVQPLALTANKTFGSGEISTKVENND